MRKPKNVLVVLVCCVIGAWWFVGQPPQQKAVVENRVEGSNREAYAPANGREPYQPVVPPVQGLGGSTLNLQASLSQAIAVQGRDDPAVLAMVYLASNICGESLRALPTTNDDATSHQWAAWYIRTACHNFDEKRLPASQVPITRSYDQIAVTDGETAAFKKAFDDMAGTSSYFDLMRGAQYLLEEGRFPDRDKYNLNEESMQKAVALAAGLRTCERMNTCGSENLITASLCARTGCPVGTPYQEAVRRTLSPIEYEAALRLRDQFARLR